MSIFRRDSQGRAAGDAAWNARESIHTAKVREVAEKLEAQRLYHDAEGRKGFMVDYHKGAETGFNYAARLVREILEEPSDAKKLAERLVDHFDTTDQWSKP